MMVLRDDRKFLVSIPEIDDSPHNTGDERRRYSSSELEGQYNFLGFHLRTKSLKASDKELTVLHPVLAEISDLDEDLIPRRTARQTAKEKRTRRYRLPPYF